MDGWVNHYGNCDLLMNGMLHDHNIVLRARICYLNAFYSVPMIALNGISEKRRSPFYFAP